MDKQLQEFLVKKTDEMTSAPSCCAEIKEAAKTWFAALNTPDEEKATKQYKADLESVILPIDAMIGFLSGDKAAGFFGADKAKHMLKHAEEIKKSGATYCDCPACSAAEAMLKKLS